MDVLIFMFFYLGSCIWHDVILWYIWHRVCMKFCSNLGKSVTETMAMIRRAWALNRNSKLIETEKDETGEEQSQEHGHNFLWYPGDFSQRIHLGRPNNQFLLLLWCFTVTAWKCVKTSPWIGDKRTGLLHHNTPFHTSFLPRNFWQKTTWLLSLTHTTFLSLPDWR
jgi:hypothetical protein